MGKKNEEKIVPFQSDSLTAEAIEDVIITAAQILAKIINTHPNRLASGVLLYSFLSFLRSALERVLK